MHTSQRMPTHSHRSDHELREELTDQLAAFRASCQSYDAGHLWEYKRLAVSLYTLLFDSVNNGHSKSLLGQLNIKRGMHFISSVGDSYATEPGEMVLITMCCALVGIRHSSEREVSYIPLLEGAMHNQLEWLPFFKWWEENIFSPTSKIQQSRKNIVFTARTQDGGAHVDRKIRNADYRTFSKGQAEGFLILQGDRQVAPQDGVKAIVRQIAWEMEQALQRAGL